MRYTVSCYDHYHISKSHITHENRDIMNVHISEAGQDKFKIWT